MCKSVRNKCMVFSGSVEVSVRGLRTSHIIPELECGPMPNLMVALPYIGGALCSTPQSLADAHY